MEARRNPYSPGAGRPPLALVGRDLELSDWAVALDRVMAGLSVQPVALYGLRGVGKTVLQTAMAKAAESHGWVVAQVEAGAGKTLRVALGEALYGPLSDLARPSSGRRILRALKTALSFKASYDSTGTWSFGVDLADSPGGGADSGVLETDLDKLVKDLSDGAGEEGVGVAVLVDEAQDLTMDELVALCAIAHRASQQGWPFLLCLAGLPSLPKDVAEAKSYAERLFAFYPITALPSDIAGEVLTVPAERAGVSWEAAGVALLVDEARGYPYFLQQYGQDTWNSALGADVITVHDARVGAALGRNALDNGFFRARWDRATRSEQAYLRGMAVDGDAVSSSGEVARRLGRKPTSLGPTRAALISKGLLYAPEHGRIAFTVPGMADFITRQPDPDAS
ncbi:ATP-binding protein [Humibacillus xanthopallidus]|uniref:Type II secretory pathway predicted ATPase ExeA n=1 Tax=Humibacillus xanthopallidus TaxID=412689 RepID=A0A543HZQ9_9MICO|nr:ATP-binding protein [Humibacillus xanthopallidus]TQM63834.1 type II secretory pathway predicted ATPase ExeA [Humibacillus xanthopallidus]